MRKRVPGCPLVAVSSFIAGQLVTEMFNYDGGGQVTAYVPPAPPEAIVFGGDGQLISQWGGILEAADVPPTMIVGIHRLDDETPRLHEYSPVFDAERFAAHEMCFVEDVRQWVRSRFGIALPAERTAMFGASASGELALAMGLRHPELCGAVFCASPGGKYRPPGCQSAQRCPRIRAKQRTRHHAQDARGEGEAAPSANRARREAMVS